jgi:hypothetical protein
MMVSKGRTPKEAKVESYESIYNQREEEWGMDGK